MLSEEERQTIRRELDQTAMRGGDRFEAAKHVPTPLAYISAYARDSYGISGNYEIYMIRDHIYLCVETVKRGERNYTEYNVYKGLIAQGEKQDHIVTSLAHRERVGRLSKFPRFNKITLEKFTEPYPTKAYKEMASATYEVWAIPALFEQFLKSNGIDYIINERN